MIAGTNLLNNRLRLRSHSIRRTFVVQAGLYSANL